MPINSFFPTWDIPDRGQWTGVEKVCGTTEVSLLVLSSTGWWKTVWNNKKVPTKGHRLNTIKSQNDTRFVTCQHLVQQITRVPAQLETEVRVAEDCMHPSICPSVYRKRWGKRNPSIWFGVVEAATSIWKWHCAYLWWETVATNSGSVKRGSSAVVSGCHPRQMQTMEGAMTLSPGPGREGNKGTELAVLLEKISDRQQPYEAETAEPQDMVQPELIEPAVDR